MAKKKAKKAAARKPAAKRKATAPKRKPAAKRPAAPRKSAPITPDKTGAALHSLLGDLRGGPMKSEEE